MPDDGGGCLRTGHGAPSVGVVVAAASHGVDECAGVILGEWRDGGQGWVSLWVCWGKSAGRCVARRHSATLATVTSPEVTGIGWVDEETQ